MITLLDANRFGRDFVMGDLHGEIRLLIDALSALQFDRAHDRLFSVGDLIDRGPNSLEALALLNEPWFFAVQGNHERMMVLHTLYPSVADDWLDNGGEWSLAVQPSELIRLARQVEQLPIAMVVGAGADRFQIVHAEMPKPDQFLGLPWDGDDIEVTTWSRRLHRNYQAFLQEHQLTAPFGQPLGKHELLTCQRYNPIRAGTSLIFCGHTTVSRPGLWQSHYFLDTGCATYSFGRLTVLPVGPVLAEFSRCLETYRGIR